MGKRPSYLLICFFIMQLAYANEAIVEVVPVYNRPAAELLPILMPLLDASADRIVANGDTLIIKTLPDRVKTLTNLVRKLDIPMANLLISVIQSRDTTAEELNAGLGGQINFPRNNPSAIRSQIGGSVNNFQGNDSTQNTQTIRILDGQTAHIQAGNVYPVTTYYQDYLGAPVVSQSRQYKDATTGFAVTPRLAGHQVSLDVSPWSDRLTPQGNLQVLEAETSIRANLGEWVEIGGIDETERISSGGVFNYNNQSSQNSLRIMVKVDVVN